MPIYISPAAMGRLAHPEGERCLARTAASHGIPYVVCAFAFFCFGGGQGGRRTECALTLTDAGVSPPKVSANSSVSFEDIAAEVPKDTILFYQVS